MILNKICPPALIYLIFSVTQVVIDTIRGEYNTAFLKIWVAIIFTILVNFLCQSGLGIISWFIVFIPFILMTLIISILLFMFGLDPATGKIKVYDSDKSVKLDQHVKDRKPSHHRRGKAHHGHKAHHGRKPHHGGKMGQEDRGFPTPKTIGYNGIQGYHEDRKKPMAPGGESSLSPQSVNDPQRILGQVTIVQKISDKEERHMRKVLGAMKSNEKKKNQILGRLGQIISSLNSSSSYGEEDDDMDEWEIQLNKEEKKERKGPPAPKRFFVSKDTIAKFAPQPPPKKEKAQSRIGEKEEEDDGYWHTHSIIKRP